jgi:hypothetical protein
MNFGKFSISSGYIRKIPLNPPLQKGEAVGMPVRIEMLRIIIAIRGSILFESGLQTYFFPETKPYAVVHVVDERGFEAV